MCGIAGIYGENSSIKINRMLSKLHHRGPDGSGVWDAFDNMALGHTRLAINDLSPNGQQPMLSVDKKIGITVNGEIYNYLELKHKLESLGAIFKSSCDSEVVLHAYQFWGTDCFKAFNGMFAIGIFDKAKDLLIIARDRLGIKPLYYHYNTDEFLFASEIKAICEVMSIQKQIDPVGLNQYLTYQNTFGERTLTKGIKLLKPGCFLTYSNGRLLEQIPFWSLSFNASYTSASLSFKETVASYQDTFDKAIKRHLMSDLDVATYLSAGLDSSSVTARVSSLSTKPICYTGVFSAGGWYDEGTIAEEIADNYCAEHIKVLINPHDLPRVIDKLVYSLDEPKMGMSSFSQYILAEQVAKRHKVILTGHGGDELFSGYPVFKLVAMLQYIKKQPYKVINLIKWLSPSEIPHFIYFFSSYLKPRYFKHYLPVLNNRISIMKGLNSNWRTLLSSLSPDDEIIEMRADGDKIQVLFANYLQSYLSGLLIVEDKISMAHALESRTPFLDNELLDLSLNTPQSIKLHNGELKAIIKAGAKDWLPKSIYSQPKRGFPTPLRLWLRKELREWMCERISGENSGLKILFEDKWLKKTCHNYLSSIKKNIRPLDEIQTHRMWQLLCLESWLRNF